MNDVLHARVRQLTISLRLSENKELTTNVNIVAFLWCDLTTFFVRNASWTFWWLIQHMLYNAHINKAYSKIPPWEGRTEPRYPHLNIIRVHAYHVDLYLKRISLLMMVIFLFYSDRRQVCTGLHYVYYIYRELSVCIIASFVKMVTYKHTLSVCYKESWWFIVRLG